MQTSSSQRPTHHHMTQALTSHHHDPKLFSGMTSSQHKNDEGGLKEPISLMNLNDVRPASRHAKKHRIRQHIPKDTSLKNEANRLKAEKNHSVTTSTSFVSNHLATNLEDFMRYEVCDKSLPVDFVNHLTQGISNLSSEELENFLIAAMYHHSKKSSRFLFSKADEHIKNFTVARYTPSKDQITWNLDHSGSALNRTCENHYLSKVSLHEMHHQVYHDVLRILAKHDGLNNNPEIIQHEQACNRAMNQFLYCLNHIVYECQTNPTNPKLLELEKAIQKDCSRRSWGHHVRLQDIALAQIARFSHYHQHYASRNSSDAVCNEFLADGRGFNIELLNLLSRSFYKPELNEHISNYVHSKDYERLLTPFLNTWDLSPSDVYQYSPEDIDQNSSDFLLGDSVREQTQYYFNYLRRFLSSDDQKRISTILNHTKQSAHASGDGTFWKYAAWALSGFGVVGLVGGIASQYFRNHSENHERSNAHDGADVPLVQEQQDDTAV